MREREERRAGEKQDEKQRGAVSEGLFSGFQSSVKLKASVQLALLLRKLLFLVVTAHVVFQLLVVLGGEFT